MQIRNSSGSGRWIVVLIRLAGLAIFALAFLQPAVTRESQAYVGWKCASVAVSFEQSVFLKPGAHHESFEYLAAISGLINPLVLLTLLASPIGALRVLRRIFALLIVACMIATWVLFSQQHIAPLTGHIMWIAGALLVIAPDAFPGGRRA